MTNMASVPAWVVVKCSSNAVRLYALLDLNAGVLAVVAAADVTGLSKGTVQRGLKELRDRGAIKRVANARYELRRDPPVTHSVPDHAGFSTDSTELSPIDQHADPQAQPLALERSRGLSTETEGSTTRARNQGENTPGVNPCDLEVTSEPPKRVLVGGRYLAFDALATECSADPRARSGEITTALKKIRQFAWDDFLALSRSFVDNGIERERDTFERFAAGEIRARAKLYRNRMRGATLTPTALAKWWFDLEKLPEQGLTPDQIASGEWRDS